ncbi:MAG: hypothetical protein WDK95_02585 [Syntrophorhabdaceae bacterium]
MILRIIPVIFALFLYITGHIAVTARWDALISFFFVTSWWAYIIILDSIVSLRSGKPMFLNRNLPEMVVISCGFWCVFELVNLRLENWFYVNIPFQAPVRYAGYLLAYGTVIPAICLTAAVAGTFFASIRTRPFTVRYYATRAITAGIILFVLALLVPGYLFGLAWVFGIFLTDGINYRTGHRSFMADLEKGSPGRLLAALASGLICGILWESWNFISPVRWIYTVPFFEGMKVFEMPVIGYIGFPVFAVETVAFFDLLNGLRKKTTLRAAILGVAVLISAMSFPLIDRCTVFSYTAPVRDLSFLTEATKRRLLDAGAKTNLSIDPGMLEPNETDTLRFVNMKGLGYANYLKLKRGGVSRARDLKDMGDRQLRRILNEENLRRVHVYQDAAKRY